jgi:hypothetical protein
MQKQRPSQKNLESGDSPHYLQIPNISISINRPKILHNNSKKAHIQSVLHFNLSKESPFHQSAPSEKYIKFPDQKSCYNVLKDNQEFKIGEDPTKRSKYFIKTKLPPLEIYK